MYIFFLFSPCIFETSHQLMELVIQRHIVNRVQIGVSYDPG